MGDSYAAAPRAANDPTDMGNMSMSCQILTLVNSYLAGRDLAAEMRNYDGVLRGTRV